MIYLNPQSLKIKNAKKVFTKEMTKFIKKRIEKKVKTNPSKNKSAFFKKIDDQIETILSGTPTDILKIHYNLDTSFSKDIKDVFNYGLFIKKSNTRFDAYNLASLLDINTCTYCNRNYTTTVINFRSKKVTRPQFDHFFDKKTYPILALSFFNLIPCCSICNSIKGSKIMSLEKFLHPYIDNEINQINFTYRYTNKTKSGLEIEIKSDLEKATNIIATFELKSIYNSHHSELADLIKIKQYFSDSYLSNLMTNVLDGFSISENDLYKIIFSTEFEQDNFISRPLSKFKKDILKELGMI